MKACREFGENALTVDGMHLTRKGNELLAALWTQSVVKREQYPKVLETLVRGACRELFGEE